MQRESETRIEIGILTRGKPTLGMVLVSLLLQEFQNIRIKVVDTGEVPVINRDDVVFALRLAFDREIVCDYQFLRERERAFSLGRWHLLDSLKGKHICFMDDDVAVPSAALSRMLPLIEGGVYGFVAPLCKNAWSPGGFAPGRPRFSPGAVFYQDELVRQVLLEYYSTTVDILDRRSAEVKVWEIAFLTELFHALGRECWVQSENVVYHLDYREGPNWSLEDEHLLGVSARKARELLQRLAPSGPNPAG